MYVTYDELLEILFKYSHMAYIKSGYPDKTATTYIKVSRAIEDINKIMFKDLRMHDISRDAAIRLGEEGHSAKNTAIHALLLDSSTDITLSMALSRARLHNHVIVTPKPSDFAYFARLIEQRS